MTMTKRAAAGRHVPGAGTTAAAEVERARSAMLHEAKPRNRTRIGADVVCEALLRQGVDVLFGYPGGVVLPLYDVLGDYPDLRHVLVRHEQGAAHAADGYARASGQGRRLPRHLRPGRHQPGHRPRHGPAGLRADGRPSPATCPRALIGKDAFQEIDITGITLPMTKHNYLVRDADELPRRHRRGVLHRAHGPTRARSTSTSPRTPCSRRRARRIPTDAEVAAGLPGFRPHLDGHPRQLRAGGAGHRRGAAAGDPGRPRRAGRARPGTSCASFAERAQIPVAHTLLGVGAIDERTR